MIAAVISLTMLGAALGLGLGIAARRFAVEDDAAVAGILALMPGSNCGQCGFAGCAGAAGAMSAGEAAPTICPPGGRALAEAIAEKLGITLGAAGADEGPQVAAVTEEICIGCCKCLKVCPTDAIVGAAKQIHNVIREACTGCGACVDRCPTEAMAMKPIPVTLQQWVWPKPLAA